jgi:hypothetical protein
VPVFFIVTDTEYVWPTVMDTGTDWDTNWAPLAASAEPEQNKQPAIAAAKKNKCVFMDIF